MRQGWYFTGLLLFVLAASGCNSATSTIESSTALGAPRSGETWDALFMQGAKVGFSHTSTAPDPQDANLLRTESESRLVLLRFGQRSEQSFLLKSWETTDGRLVRFSTEMRQGSELQRTEGTVEGNSLLVTAVQGERRQTVGIPWTEQDRGFQAVEQSLRAQPLQPGETRRIRALMPVINLVAVCDLTAQKLEATPLLEGSRSLLRIEKRDAIVAGTPPLVSTLWCDEQGEVIKSHSPAASQEGFRTTREIAESGASEASFDLGTMSSVIVAKPAKDPQAAKSVNYRVELKDADPLMFFAQQVGQDVRSVGANTAEITVHFRRLSNPGSAIMPIGPALPTVPGAGDAPPTAADRQPSAMIQSDDPAIIELANLLDGSSSPWDQATFLEAIVARTIKNKNLSQTFSSAAETLASRQGDCTEHAVLLAALCRARGIPARVTTGLVYVPNLPGFAFHMWTEVYINQAWCGLDGTLGRGGITTGHIKFSHTSLESSNSIASFLPLLQLLGRLKIEIVSISP